MYYCKDWLKRDTLQPKLSSFDVFKNHLFIKTVYLVQVVLFDFDIDNHCLDAWSLPVSEHKSEF